MSRPVRACPDEVARLKATACIVTLINETLPLTRNGRVWISRCPFHGERTPSFTVYPGHYHCFGCGAHGDVLDWLMGARQMPFSTALAYLGLVPQARQPNQPTPALAPLQPRATPTARIFRCCWAEGVQPRGTIVESYLASRGLYLPTAAAIRFHPRCQRGPSSLPNGPTFAPAMLALMTDPLTGEPIGLHRTFLQPDGSGKAAPISRGNLILPSKSILGSWGAVRFPPPADTQGALAIAEGIENALTVQQRLEWEWGPVWAAGTQNAIAQFPILPEITSLTIFADADDAGVGIRAARLCEARWREAGRHVELRIPPKGQDWNSTLNRRAE